MIKSEGNDYSEVKAADDGLISDSEPMTEDAKPAAGAIKQRTRSEDAYNRYSFILIGVLFFLGIIILFDQVIKLRADLNAKADIASSSQKRNGLNLLNEVRGMFQDLMRNSNTKNQAQAPAQTSKTNSNEISKVLSGLKRIERKISGEGKICTTPPKVPNWSAGQVECGTGCPNDNIPYDTLQEAWDRCSKVEACGIIMHWEDRKYYLREKEGVVTIVQTGSRWMDFAC